MEAKEIVLEGRKYKAFMSGEDNSGAFIVVGPPEGLVDALGLPEPFATNLHNALYYRGILSAADASKHPRDVAGAMQEALSVDVQKLVELFFTFDKES